MIKFEYKDFTIGLILLEGRQFDNNSVPIVFNGNFPAGYTWELLLACRENLNIINLQATTEGYVHLFTAQELSQTGRYTVQLRGTSGTTVRHTNTVNMFIPSSLSGNTQWPVLPTAFSEALNEAKALSPPAGGATGQVLAKASNADHDYYWKTVSGGGGGTTDYLDLENKPRINGTELVWNTVLQVLPTPSVADNGKIAKIVNGQWAIAEDLKLSITETANPEGGNTITIGG